MAFQNLGQIKKEFKLAEDEPQEIKKKLLGLLADLHPDKHGGKDFASPRDKKKYLKINEAIEFIKILAPEQSTALVPVNEIKELANLVRDLVLVDKKVDKIANSESRLSERIEKGLSQLGKQYLAPRITVSAITAALTFVWFLPTTISESSFLKSYINVNDPSFFMIWITSLLLTIFVLYQTSISEDRQRRFQSRLKTETFQNHAFDAFLDIYYDGPFARSDFVEFLATYWESKNKKRNTPLSSKFLPLNLLLSLIGATPLSVDPESAQLIADIVFERAERRGVIQKDETAKRLEEVYSLSEDYEE